MNNPISSRLARQLQYAYEGPAWHGPSIKKVLAEVTAGKMLNHHKDSHNIAELIEHMTAWRVFAIKKLQGDREYDVTAEQNFPKIREQSASRLEEAKARLEDSQQQLLSLIREFPDEKLTEKAPPRNYDFYILLQGVIQHDLYHLGQIILLAKD